MGRISKIKYRNLPVVLPISRPKPTTLGVIYEVLTQFREGTEYTEDDIEALHKFHRDLILTLNMRFSLAYQLKEEFWEVSDRNAFSETNQVEIVPKDRLLTIFDKIKGLSDPVRSGESISVREMVLKGPGRATYDKGDYYLRWEKQNRKDKLPGERTSVNVVLFDVGEPRLPEAESEACPAVPYDYFPEFYDAKASREIYDYLTTLPYDYTYYYFTMRGKRIVKSPRKMIWFAENDVWPYCYTRKHIECLPVHKFTPELQDIKRKVEEFTGHSFNALLINEYQPTDFLGWHSDDDPWLGDQFIVPSLSCGAERRFQLRNKEDKNIQYTVRLENGSMIVMKDKCQELWQHRVPKQTKKEFRSGIRYNLTFRYIHPDLVEAQYKRFNRVTWDDMREIRDELIAGSEYIP